MDDGVMAWPSMRRFVEFDAGVVGGDPVIEKAKTLLCDELGISRRDAFAILRRTSSNANGKVREVARGLVDESRGAGAWPATSPPPSDIVGRALRLRPFGGCLLG